jgi:hypothetical protein
MCSLCLCSIFKDYKWISVVWVIFATMCTNPTGGDLFWILIFMHQSTLNVMSTSLSSWVTFFSTLTAYIHIYIYTYNNLVILQDNIVIVQSCCINRHVSQKFSAKSPLLWPPLLPRAPSHTLCSFEFRELLSLCEFIFLFTALSVKLQQPLQCIYFVYLPFFFYFVLTCYSPLFSDIVAFSVGEIQHQVMLSTFHELRYFIFLSKLFNFCFQHFLWYFFGRKMGSWLYISIKRIC